MFCVTLKVKVKGQLMYFLVNASLGYRKKRAFAMVYHRLKPSSSSHGTVHSSS